MTPAGQGERAVKTLFVLAGLLQPSVIFIDEIDSLLSARKAEGKLIKACTVCPL